MSASGELCKKVGTDSRWSWLDRFARTKIASLVDRMSDVSLRIEDELGVMESVAVGRDAITVQVVDPRTYRQILFGGSIGAAEAYMDGHWTTQDLAGVCRTFARQWTILNSMDRGLGRLKAPLRRVWHMVRRNTRTGSRRNIAAHYDLSNEFFSLFLDPTMTYSSGYFSDKSTTMQDASLEKYDRLCRKLELKTTDHVLEIGCGWGGFARYAAKTYGCSVTGVTISREQFEFASKHVRREGLEGLVHIRLQDYRDIEGQFDKIVSIEMIEAVGQEYYAEYFGRCAKLLRPDGLFVIQAITIPDQMYDFSRRNVDFIKRYIFPGGCLPSVTAISDTLRTHTNLNIVYLNDMGLHYAETLRRWHKAFLDQEERVRALGFDGHFIRMWRYYLAYCEAGFDERLTGVAQIVMAAPMYRPQLSSATNVQTSSNMEVVAS